MRIRTSCWCRLTFLAFIFDLVMFPNPVSAQTYEIGMQFAGMHLHKIDETPYGVGARLDYNFQPLVAADLEFMHYPENPSGNFGESTVLIGCRLGRHFDRFGVFGAVRPGVIHFGGTYFAERLDQRTHPMMNIGGTLEYYPSRRTVVRINLDDAIIYYGALRGFGKLRIDGARQLAVTAYCVHSFFDAYLKQPGTSHLQISSPLYPEIRILD